MMKSIHSKNAVKAPYGVDIDEFTRRLGQELSADSDLTLEALWSLSRAFQALSLLGVTEDGIYAKLRYLWQVLLRLRSKQPPEQLDQDVLNRYGELGGMDNYTRLTRREREVIRLVALGWTNVHIADELRISESTVRKHLVNIFEKLEVHNRVSAIVVASRLGLLGEERPAGKRNWRMVKRTRKKKYGT